MFLTLDHEVEADWFVTQPKPDVAIRCTHCGKPWTTTADFAVLKDGAIKKVEDLKGKVLVTNGIGGGLDMIMKAEMLKHGMIDKRDFSVIEINFPNMKSVLEERKADLIPSTLPWSRNPAQAAITRTLFTTADAMGHVALSFWVAHKGFLDKNHAAMVDFLEDYLRSIHWYLDPKNHDAAVKSLRAANGKSFDRAFLEHEVAFHKAVIDAVTETLLPALKNEEARALVTKVAPAFQAHMVAAQNLLDKQVAAR